MLTLTELNITRKHKTETCNFPTFKISLRSSLRQMLMTPKPIEIELKMRV